MTAITWGSYMQPFWSSLIGGGVGHCLSGKPDLTKMSTFFSVPLPLTTTSCDFCGVVCALAQAGVASMLMFFSAGLSPVNDTFPVSVAAFASSTGLAAGAVAGASVFGASDVSVLLPPHPARSSIEAAPQLLKNFFIFKPSFNELTA